MWNEQYYSLNTVTTFDNKNKNLVVLQWNCRSLNSNLDYLTHYLSQHSVHVLCVQSPACRRGELPKIDGYYYPTVSGLHPSISGRVGTVTYVKIGCKFETVASQLEAGASICSIKTEQTTRHITVHNVYYPECDGEGEWLKYHSDSHCLMIGDFNQHSVLWEDGYMGREPKLGIAGSDFVLLNDGTLTRVPDRSVKRWNADQGTRSFC